MKKVCFTAVEDRLYYLEGCNVMASSFKLFHPDIDFVIFGSDVVNKLFKKQNINWYQAKPFLAEILEDKYDLVVNMDADHFVAGRMYEVFDNVNYDVALPSSVNDYENASFGNITKEMFLQAGLVASTSKKFWKKWREENREAMKYLYKENAIVNLVIYNQMPELNLKVLDKEKDYYGCKSLNRESEFYIENDKLMCRGEQVVVYHHAKGQVFPKLDFKNMSFQNDVKEWLYKLGSIPFSRK